MKPLLAGWLGLVDYDEAYALQKECVRERRAFSEAPDRLILLEHPTVYTFGRKAEGVLPFLPPAVHAVSRVIERGGEATFHNPGQLVAYPIVKMEDGDRDIPAFLRALEQAVIDTLAEDGIVAGRRAGATGVWLADKNKKIASVGVAITGWVTYHGLALNVCNDLSGFQAIHPCGFSPDVMTSMKEVLGERVPDVPMVTRRLAGQLARLLRRELVWDEAPDGERVMLPSTSANDVATSV